MPGTHLTRSSSLLALASLLLALAGCATTIRPGEVAMKQRFGRLSEEPRGEGLMLYTPVMTRVIRVPTRTVNLAVIQDLPSKEGLNIQAEISILYRIGEESAPQVVTEIGPDYEDTLILPVFRSAAADVCARFLAKDMHTAERARIEHEISTRMAEILAPRGFVIESVLLKTIRLPPGLYAAIEEKLSAEQEAQRMEFVLQRERLEAERMLIEAQGVRDAQRVLAEGISPILIQWRSIEAFEALSQSPNAKVIITDGQTPLAMPQAMSPSP